MPEISVLMPVWNGCREGKDVWLRQAIDSILKQTFSNFEFVIVDDGSTDQTWSVLQEVEKSDQRVRIFRNDSNLKIVRTLNRGISLCQAPLIARMDADDISFATRLEIQKKFLDDRPETAMVGSGMQVIDGEGRLKMLVRHVCAYPSIREFLKRGCAFVHGSVMYRKSVVESLEGYSADPQLEYAEDYDLWVRMAAKHTVENIPDEYGGMIFYAHRDHGSKSSFANRSQQDRASQLIMSKAQELMK